MVNLKGSRRSPYDKNRVRYEDEEALDTLFDIIREDDHLSQIIPRIIRGNNSVLISHSGIFWNKVDCVLAIQSGLQVGFRECNFPSITKNEEALNNLLDKIREDDHLSARFWKKGPRALAIEDHLRKEDAEKETDLEKLLRIIKTDINFSARFWEKNDCAIANQSDLQEDCVGYDRPSITENEKAINDLLHIIREDDHLSLITPRIIDSNSSALIGHCTTVWNDSDHAVAFEIALQEDFILKHGNKAFVALWNSEYIEPKFRVQVLFRCIATRTLKLLPIILKRVGANERLDGVSRYPLHVAADPSFTDLQSEEARKSACDIVRLLLSKKAHLNATDGNGDTAYDLAKTASKGNEATIELLQNKMKKLDIELSKGNNISPCREREANLLRMALKWRLQS